MRMLMQSLMQLMSISRMELVLLALSCEEEDSKFKGILRFWLSEVQKLSDQWTNKHGNVPTGSAAWTLPGKMKNCKYIIHAVGPVWSNVRASP